MLQKILSRFRRKDNSQPVPASRYLVSDAQEQIIAMVAYNLAAGQLVIDRWPE